ncbi:MAG: hypothetical protein CVV02_11585 [Firmicutes bacterium HGW-Firmicutes-7]|nr:MAG: hypothetical protein CVV02_11585 [Firmicutes bacterium HGW-Firmicutes-7]
MISFGSSILNNSKKVHIGVGILFLTIILVVFVGISVNASKDKTIYGIYLGNKEIGYVKNQDIIELAVQDAIDQLEDKLGTKILIESKLMIEPIQQIQHNLKDDKELADKLFNTLLANEDYYKIQAYEILIDNATKVIVNDQVTATLVLEEIKDSYIPTENKENIQEVSIIESVTKTPEYALKADIMTKDEAKTKLLETTEEKKVYAINEGDTLSEIAYANKIQLEELLKLNPELKDDNVLKIGQEINLMIPKSKVSVRTKETTVYVEPIEKAVEYQYDANQYTNYSDTIQQGKEGVKEVTATVTRINGLEERIDIDAEKVLEEPLNIIIVVGTKKIPLKQATGSYQMPVKGVITSTFGPRWGTFHEGLDIAAPTGTRISAADGGTVIYSGWNNGGYGYLVKVDHGKGFVTYYAHNSKLLVEVGQKVAKGEVIAAVGSTGNSTGPHLHFEIRKNGNPQNPYNYL